MRCRYRESLYECGDYLEGDVYPVFHTAPKKRRTKYKPTRAMQEKLNQRNAERALARLLNANFSYGDIEVSLTYAPEHLPACDEDAERDCVNFIRRVKRLRAKMKLGEIKYIKVTGGGTRYHHHVVMTGGITRESIEELWGKGFANARRLSPNEDGLAGLGYYICRQLCDEDIYNGLDLFSEFDINEETGELTEREGISRKKGKRRWSASKNLIRPEPVITDGRIPQYKVQELCTVDSANRAEFEALYPGYSFVRCEAQYNEDNGGWYLHIRMRRRK